MTGARDVARVLDARIRQMLDGVQPQPPGPWTGKVPDTGSAEINRYLRQLAEAMDDRVRRLGEHATQTQPRWAMRALGPIPDDPVSRLDWEHRARTIAAYRERYGYQHPADPIGPEPGKTSPEARAAWHGALAALGRVDGIDVRGCTDGELWLRRVTYVRETAWAPPHVGTELRLMRIAERDTRVSAIRAQHETSASTDRQAADRHRQLARIWRALQAKAATEAAIFATAQETRQQWETMTETTRRIAIAADIELRRRHPGLRLEPLRPHPAEAAGITYPDHAAPAQEQTVWVQPTLDGSEHLAPARAPAQQTNDRASSPERDADGQLALGLTPDTARDDIPEQVLRIRENARIAQATLDELTSTQLPGAGEYDLPAGLAWPAAVARDRDAILQPPQPDIVPSAHILRHYQATHANADYDPERG